MWAALSVPARVAFARTARSRTRPCSNHTVEPVSATSRPSALSRSKALAVSSRASDWCQLEFVSAGTGKVNRRQPLTQSCADVPFRPALANGTPNVTAPLNAAARSAEDGQAKPMILSTLPMAHVQNRLPSDTCLPHQSPDSAGITTDVECQEPAQFALRRH